MHARFVKEYVGEKAYAMRREKEKSSRSSSIHLFFVSERPNNNLWLMF